MKRILLAILMSSLLAPTGCSVLEEIDSAGDKMDALSGPKAEEVVDSTPNALPTRNELLEQSKQWWSEATSLAPKAVDSKIVSCKTREGMQFMSKDDCLTRGGVPKGVSG